MKSKDITGFINIAKPKGVTAHDVVAMVRRTIGMKQVGHGGTLDPMATGVLPIACGKATRLLRFLPGDKTYLAQITLGLQTSTDDITGEAIAVNESAVPQALEPVATALQQFAGQIKQLPPMYSAVHVGGQRLYELARKGQAPDTVPEREITVFSIELLDYRAPILTARIACSAGTYIRSIARDLGSNLGCGGCLSALAREQAGPFRIEQSVTIDELKERVAAGDLASVLTAPETILPLDRLDVDETDADHLRHGRSIALRDPMAGEHVLVLSAGPVNRRLPAQRPNGRVC